jgi:manganese/zinc/iron transport system ATP- binding protein
MLELTGVRTLRNGEAIMSTTGTPPPLLKIEGLSVAYGPVMALQNVNLELLQSSLVGVIGPNGAGKSSLLKGVLGMVPASGKISVAGQSLAQARQRISYVPQRSAVRWDFPVTVEEVVMMGRYKHIGWVKFPGKADRQIVAETLSQVGMYDLRQRQISQLSGGQQQRVFLARALAQQGDIMLLDEPLTGVDTTSREVIMGLLEKLRSEGKLIVMATHDLHTAARECNYCCCINHRLVAMGTPEQIFKPEVLAETYGEHVLTVNPGNSTNGATLIIQ